MVPIASIFNFPFFVHGLVMLEGLLEVWEDQSRMVKVGDAGIFGVSADVDHLAATFKQVGWKHGNRHVSFDDPG